MRRAVAIAATLAGVCLLEGLSKLGRSPTELIYADGRLGDVPGFNEEAQMQWKSGELADHTNLWEAPGYFNNRGIRDLARDKMDARMTYDASHSGWSETGGADFAQDDALYNPATDTDSFSLNSGYDNSWPGTGSGLMDYGSLSNPDDGYDGEWGLTPLDDEGSSAAAVSGADLAGFKAVRGGTMLAQEGGGDKSCIKCFWGEECIAGCLSQRMMAKRRAREIKVAEADVAKEGKAVREEYAEARRQEREREGEEREREVEAQAATSRERAAAAQARQRQAQKQYAALHKCEEAGLDCGHRSSRSGPKRINANGRFMLRALEHLHAPSPLGDDGASQQSMKLAKAGVIVDRDPLVDERSMPEQGGQEGSFEQNMLEFFDTGSKLKKEGVVVA